MPTIDNLKKAAERGDVQAQYDLATWYMTDEGLAYFQYDENKMYEQVVYWLKKSASQGHAQARKFLSMIENPEMGTQKIREAAENGDANCQLSLAQAYFEGNGIEKDPAKGLYWLRQAVEQGNGDAYFQLGSLYYLGQFVKKDWKEAIYWLKKGIYNNIDKHKIIRACYIIGACYFGGSNGINLDFEAAFQYYKIAADQGDSEGQYMIGVYYCDGIYGVEKDLNQAIYWLKESAKQGNKNAIEKLEKIIKI